MAILSSRVSLSRDFAVAQLVVEGVGEEEEVDDASPTGLGCGSRGAVGPTEMKQQSPPPGVRL